MQDSRVGLDLVLACKSPQDSVDNRDLAVVVCFGGPGWVAESLSAGAEGKVADHPLVEEDIEAAVAVEQDRYFVWDCCNIHLP